MDYQVITMLAAAVSTLQLIHPAGAISFDRACAPLYKNISPQHTMCIVGEMGTEVVLDAAAKDNIVRQHNNLRGRVMPLAGDMAKVVWDPYLALFAAKWARQCRREHDLERSIPWLPGIQVGQNIGIFGKRSYDSRIQDWYDEAQYFVYGVGPTTGHWKDVAHYTQVVFAKTQRIGCGIAACPNSGKYIVCNYAVKPYRMEFPYLNSTHSCSECPRQCDASGKLCDCGGKLCLNGGTLDVATCTCSCEKPLFSGDTCETLTCPGGDSRFCGPGNTFKPSYCTRYNNIRGACPYMCGVCSHACGDKMCYNGGTMNYQTCQCTCIDLYTGDTCETLHCPEADKSWCGPGKSWPPESCDIHRNVRPSCPYMCGLCQHRNVTA